MCSTTYIVNHNSVSRFHIKAIFFSCTNQYTSLPPFLTRTYKDIGLQQTFKHIIKASQLIKKLFKLICASNLWLF
ncbi:hypothetical protein ALO39_200017 [Pseudomonas syringae pv. lapsa]|nr:hypothetical protein ALO39_200017 [Pseudomonas syringae pv. lapsa]